VPRLSISIRCPKWARTNRIRLGMIAVPAAGAQTVADRFGGGRVEGILNFAPVTISLPDHVSQWASIWRSNWSSSRVSVATGPNRNPAPRSAEGTDESA